MTRQPGSEWCLRTSVGKADLLRFLRHGDASELDFIAPLFGLESVAVKKPRIKKDSPQVEPTGTITLDPPEPPPVPNSKPCLNYWRPVHYEAKEPPEGKAKVPAWVKHAQPFENKKDARGEPPPSPPLTPWPRLWPFLRNNLGGPRESLKVDVVRLVRKIAKNQAIQHLPRLKRVSWAPRCQILVDFDERLSLFWGDFWRLLAGLERLRGKEGMDVYLFHSGPDGQFRRLDGDRWLDEPYQPPPLGCPILVLSDLGFYAQRHQPRLAWLDLGEYLYQRGHRPTALLPCPRRLWRADMLYPWRTVCWDRVPLKPRSALALREEDQVQTDGGALQLLHATAPAIRVEPGLLRALRLLLPRELVDVGSEAQVWHHPDVASNPVAMLLKPEGDIIQRMRDGFHGIKGTALKKTILATIEAFHQFLPEVIGHEERLIRRCLMEEPLTDADMTFLGRYIKTRQKLSKNHVFSDAARRWFARLESRLHEAMRGLEPIATAQLYEKRKHENQQSVTIPAGVDGMRFAWLYDQRTDFSEWGLLADGKGLRLRLSSESVSLASLAQFQMQSQVFQYSTANEAQMVSLETKLEIQLMEPGGGSFSIGTDHQEIRFEVFEKPDWVKTIRRDGRGLCVTAQDHVGEERELHWLRPGPINLEGSSPEVSGLPLVLSKGCWLEKTIFEQIFPNDAISPTFQCPTWASEIRSDADGLFADLEFSQAYLRMRLIFPNFTIKKPTGSPATQIPTTLITQPFWISQRPFPVAFSKPYFETQTQKSSSVDGTEPIDPFEPIRVKWEETEGFFAKINTRFRKNLFQLPDYVQWFEFFKAGIKSAQLHQLTWLSNGLAYPWPDEISLAGLGTVFAKDGGAKSGMMVRKLSKNENHVFYLVSEF